MCRVDAEGRPLVTIAVCYLSPEGFVLGADSTSTYLTGATPHYFNHAQKIFEIGQDSTLAIVTWGLGGLQVKSHRFLVACLADDLEKKKPKNVKEVADRWTAQFWDAYTTGLATDIARVKSLAAQQPFSSGALDARTEEEEKELNDLSQALVAGFCLGGYVKSDRSPSAYVVVFDPLAAKPTPQSLPMHTPFGWGAPNMIKRLIIGIDDGLKSEILACGKWTGTQQELDALVSQYVLSQPILPIRDAVDFVHTCVHSTIKAFKFSNLAQICGGPIELAVVTVDRNFRWVRHKTWDSAIEDGEPQ